MSSYLTSRDPGLVPAIAIFFLLSACGGGGGSGSRDRPPPPRPPEAASECVSTPHDTPLVSRLPGTDPDGDALVFSLVDRPLKGSIDTDSAGNYRYTPDPNVRGLDRFTYRVTDETGLTSSIATITVLVDGKMRIMPLGDSITSGAASGATAASVGYRRKLYADLNALYPGRIDFVGSLSHGLAANPPIGDPDHEGHGGFTASQIADNVIGYLDANPPDVVLLHIGTNNFQTSGGDVATILDRIDAWEAANYPVTVFLARIIDDGDPTVGSPPDLQVEVFNNDVQSRVATRPNDRVIMVDQQRGAGFVYLIGDDMVDDLHPNQRGYDKMADEWKAELTSPGNVGSKFLGMPTCQ